jgi:DNA-binding transcriptional LysR family regulator
MKINTDNTNLNFRHLRAVHAIVSEGSFARAAQRLGVVPSALTETVRQLEAIIGAPLFDRRARPPRITAVGLDLIESTGNLLDGFDRTLDRIKRSVNLEEGQLSIGASPSVISGLLAPAFVTFRRTYPGISITLRDDVAERLALLVSAGELDLAVAGSTMNSTNLIQREIGSDPFGLACRADHPLALRQRPVMLSDIDPAQLIHLDEETGTARLLSSHEHIPDAMRSGPVRVHSTIGQLCLIRAGAGVGLLPRDAVHLFNDRSIAFVRIADLDLSRRLYLLQPRFPVSHVAERFISMIAMPAESFGSE